MREISLEKHGIHVSKVYHNVNPAQAYEQAILQRKGSHLVENGALVAYSGAKTGRSPLDKRVVKNPDSENDIWWGSVNIPFEESSFQKNRQIALEFLNSQDALYCVDGFAGWDPTHRIKVRVICSRVYHALFMYTMLIRPNDEELASFGDPDYVLYNAGQASADPTVEGVKTTASIALNFEDREFVILGSEYAGEMKKGIFTIMNYLMPKEGVLSMHCSATADPETGSSSILFGLSGTGKTTLSADPHRQLVGDDEHCWTDTGIFNIEGGCYAKAINLSEESEPDIFRAIRFGSVLENVKFDSEHNRVDYHDTSITENTRCAYPIEYIKNSRIPCIAGHPTDIIFLTCDAFGVLPPVSHLSPEQAMYHFISGYTAKVAGTEVGVTEPEATFSPCFGGPFLVWHPTKYAEMLAEKIREHGSYVWLVNTGWSGGAYGRGSRMKLKFTRAIIDAIHSGVLREVACESDPIFGFQVPQECPGVPSEILTPKNTWSNETEFDATIKKLAYLFQENFKKYSNGAGEKLKQAGPRVE
ncbi:MAG: phosphoenolpyruvate carboxykinase (ATP) [Candidatus Omnitrophica bacterium]|nr:phosphoenolpyruvate carboxykinase (ATP) [Candidatus Omnitrophota bacterium]MCB9783964.1 phosphoenolpyruvate carboxykinase (ATP) [Candidatus Omnitrophota bacterium]